MTPARKPPHCRTCHKSLKGHKRGVCDNTDDPPSPTTIPPSPAVRTKTHKSPSPLERPPTLSSESNQTLNDILLVKSHTFPPLQVPEVKPTIPRRSARVAKHDESLRETSDSSKVDNKEQKPKEKITSPSNHNEILAMPGAWEKKSVPQAQSQTNAPPKSSSCVVSQQLVIKASSKDSSIDPLTINISQQLKLEDSTPGEPCNHQQKLAASDAPATNSTIHNFLDSMTKDLQSSPAIIFSYPISGVASLKDNVESHGLCMHILSLPQSKQEWTPVVIGRDMNAIMKLLEDGEKLAQGVRRPNNVNEMKLGMSHVVVGALGALVTWAGLAYT